MVLQIYRPDIVITLPEFNPVRPVPETLPTARTPGIEDDETRREIEERVPTPTELEAGETYESVAHPKRPPEPALLAAQIMTEMPVILALDAPLSRALRLFREYRFRHLPLTNAEGRIDGMLSERDVLHHVADVKGRRGSVAELATREVLTATPETSIRAIAATMLERRVGSVPIVDSAGRPLGIVTRTDILRALVRHAPLEMWA